LLLTHTGSTRCGRVSSSALGEAMRRRDFIALTAGATAAWPLAASGQQTTMPVIGFLGATSPAQTAELLAAFRRILAEAGYVEGRDVIIDYRFADGQYDRLPELAGELIQRRVAVIVTGASTPSTLAAKAATATIPIVFGVGGDPVKLGLVASLARPGGNATGVNFFLGELGAKLLGVLRELFPTARRVSLLHNPNNSLSVSVASDVVAAATTLGVQIDVIEVHNASEVEPAFATIATSKTDALLIGADNMLYSRRVELATLASRYAIPALSTWREMTEIGGLMSYGTNLFDAYRQIAAYTVLILKGAKPADLPVVQSTKFELVINLPTARTLGLTVPPTLLAIADEVIE
jgi:putative tryptophan/tyrosine transport system substrate-binding protein